MRNDLISRSALLKELSEFCGQQRYLVPENIWDMIESAPTAYDVDKVVEQLSELNENELTYGRIIAEIKAGGVNE